MDRFSRLSAVTSGDVAVASTVALAALLRMSVRNGDGAVLGSDRFPESESGPGIEAGTSCDAANFALRLVNWSV